MNFKKLFSLIAVFAFIAIVAACSPSDATITFESNGGTNVASVSVKKDTAAQEPKEPTKNGFNFLGWFENEDLTGESFDFSTKIKKDLTLYAKWTDGVVVRLDQQVAEPVKRIDLGVGGGKLDKPTDPTREGYRFGGWFYGKAGLTWLEPEAVEFPLEVNKATSLYAYWEPIDSKAVDYTAAETYTTSVTEGITIILNPLSYTYSHEDDYIDMMVTPIYTSEVDWDLAIKEGVADFVGDFSKIEAQEHSADAFDYHYILVGGTRFPLDKDGNEHLTPEGKYDVDEASKIMSTEWTIHLRDDMKFEDGTPIDAHTFEYSLKQYLDPIQNNYRSTIFYKTEENQNGYAIKNAAEYRMQLLNEEEVSWDTVGFEVLDDYSFKVTFFEPASQSNAVGLANSIRLVHPEKFEASFLNETDSTYGTAASPYVSYGPYILKSWDENQMLVFNKNYDYVARDTISYKSQVIQVVADIATQTQLYKQGALSVLGLNNENYNEFSEDASLKRGWNGMPQYLALNLAGSRKTEGGHEQPSIMFDKRFRQAMFYGFDRNYYASNVYAPNAPSILPIPIDAKGYLEDAILYNQSPQHLSVLEKHNMDPSLNGFIPARAKQLFDQAYADWIAEGNTGPVVLKYISSNDSDLVESMALYVKENYEELFNDEGYNKDNPEKFKIEIQWGTGQTTDAAQKEWDFDMALINVGFGASYGAHWQYPFIAYLGAISGGDNLGLSQPFDLSGPTEDENGNKLGAYMSQEIEVDFTNTYNYLQEIKDNEDTNPTMLELIPHLEETDDKPAGIYRGENGWLAQYAIRSGSPWRAATASEPFNGAIQDVWNMLAAFEDVFYEHVTMVPTVTRASATVYQPNVNILWPEYTTTFGWGANRYRYLSSDPTMVDGFYNAFEVAFKEAQEN